MFVQTNIFYCKFPNLNNIFRSFKSRINRETFDQVVLEVPKQKQN